jgi:pimeloyl-ACP methyl ester carboxylesterase
VSALLKLLVLLTLASLAYNLATRNRDTLHYTGPSVVVDGTRLAYRHWGAHGSAILLLGGFVEPTWVWHRTAPLLARDHRVFAVDLPPFGYSQRRGPYSLARWTALARGFIHSERLGRPVVVGHSLGAAVAVTLAGDASGIVLLDGDALPGGGGPTWLAKLLVPPWFTSAYRLVTGSDFVFRQVLHSALGPGGHADPAMIDELQRPFRIPGTAAAFKAMLRYGIQGVSEQALRIVRTSSLVLWGADDSVDSPAAGRKSAALLHTRFEAIPGAGHLSMLVAPAAVARAVDEFTARTRSYRCGPARSRSARTAPPGR